MHPAWYNRKPGDVALHGKRVKNHGCAVSRDAFECFSPSSSPSEVFMYAKEALSLSHWYTLVFKVRSAP
jgi:hypothetical protein